MGRAVVVVGGGYGGSMVASALDLEADVVLVDQREAFVNAAASLRALTRPSWAPHAFFPFGTLLSRGRVVRDRVVSVDAGGVVLASGEQVAFGVAGEARGGRRPVRRGAAGVPAGGA